MLKAFKFACVGYVIIYSFKSNINGGNFIYIIHTVLSAYLGASISQALWAIKLKDSPSIEIKKINFEKDHSKEHQLELITEQLI